MNEEDLNKYLAKQQNVLDHLARKIYGGQVKFDNLSPFGQHTIESLARERSLLSDPDPELRQAKTEVATLRQELHEANAKLAAALRDNQDLWEENEELRMERDEWEEDRSLREQRGRKKRDT